MLDQQVAQAVVAIGRRSAAGIDLLGTGFAVGTNKIATAAHVSTSNDTDLGIIVPKCKQLSDYQDTTDTNVHLVFTKISALDPIRDISILEFTDPGSRFTFRYSLLGSDQVSPGASVTSLGFPHTNYGRLVLTQHVSSVGARILLGSSGIKVKHLVLNTQARPGQSGGPVFVNQGTAICAMIIGGFRFQGDGVVVGGIDPATLHQTTHAVSAEYIRDML